MIGKVSQRNRRILLTPAILRHGCKKFHGFCSNVVTMCLLALVRSVSFDVWICLLLIKAYSREKSPRVHWICRSSEAKVKCMLDPRTMTATSLYFANTSVRISILFHRRYSVFRWSFIRAIMTFCEILNRSRTEWIHRSQILFNYRSFFDIHIPYACPKAWQGTTLLAMISKAIVVNNFRHKIAGLYR